MTRDLAARERRFQRMLAVAKRNPEVDGDALLEELEREDAECRARTQARTATDEA
jgi:hypothetical protein